MACSISNYPHTFDEVFALRRFARSPEKVSEADFTTSRSLRGILLLGDDWAVLTESPMSVEVLPILDKASCADSRTRTALRPLQAIAFAIGFPPKLRFCGASHGVGCPSRASPAPWLRRARRSRPTAVGKPYLPAAGRFAEQSR